MQHRLSRRRFLQTSIKLGAGLSALSTASAWSVDIEEEFYLLNWPEYMLPEVLERFGKRAGMPAKEDVYTNDLGLLAKFIKAASKYDVIIAPSNLAPTLHAGVLGEIDKKLIPNLEHLDSQWLSADYDPNRRFTLPYFWGTIGIGYNKKAVRKSPDSWKLLFDSSQLKGRIALFDDADTTIGLALK